MIALVLMAALGGIVFVEQDIPEVRVGHGSVVRSSAELNLRRGDVDGDGATDLIFKSHVVFQREGVFSQAKRVDLPEGLDDVLCDTWDGALYLRRPGRLTVLRWGGGAWREALNQPIAWPDLQAPDEDEAEKDEEDEEEIEGEEGPGVQFDRFLHDLDGDDGPELILPARDGLLIYAREGDRYTRKGLLDIAPPPEMWGNQRLWPREKRGITPLRPYRHWWFHVQGNRITVVTRKGMGGEEDRFDVARYTLDEHFAVVPEQTQAYSTEPMGDWPQPVRLNNDGTIDYADWEFLDGLHASPMPTPVCEMRLSTDAGGTLQVFRAAWALSCGTFVDFEGDGDQDLVLITTGVFRGGVRESVARVVTQRTVEYEVGVHLQDAHGVFSKAPDLRIPLTIRLDKPLIHASDMAERYGSGLLADLGGDVDGDGRVDLVVHDQPGRLAVYLNRGDGFASDPDATVATQSDWRFRVADIDGDGRSDIVFRVEVESEDAAAEESRVLLTREVSP